MQKLTYSLGYKKVIESLIKARIELGFKQEDIADLLKIQQCDVSKIETLERELTIGEFIVLLHFYHLDYHAVTNCELFLEYYRTKLL